MNEYQKRNFCNHDASLALRGLGYKEKSIAVHYSESLFEVWQKDIYMNSVPNCIAAPTFLDAIAYLWIEHGIDVVVHVLTYTAAMEGYYHWSVDELIEDKFDMFTQLEGEEKTRHQAYNTSIIKACEYIKKGEKDE